MGLPVKPNANIASGGKSETEVLKELATKVAVGFGKKLLSGVNHAMADAGVKPEQFDCLWNRVDGTLLAINAAHDWTRDDGWRGGHVADQIELDMKLCGFSEYAWRLAKAAVFYLYNGKAGYAFQKGKLAVMKKPAATNPTKSVAPDRPGLVATRVGNTIVTRNKNTGEVIDAVEVKKLPGGGEAADNNTRVFGMIAAMKAKEAEGRSPGDTVAQDDTSNTDALLIGLAVAAAAWVATK